MIERFNAMLDVGGLEFEGPQAFLIVSRLVEGGETADEAINFFDENVLPLPIETARGVLPGDRVVVSGYLDADDEDVYDVVIQTLEVVNLQDFDIEIEDEELEEEPADDVGL